MQNKTKRLAEWQRILIAFRGNGNILTPLDITNGLKIQQYNRAISDLRKHGYHVVSEELGTIDGIRHTRFILCDSDAHADDEKATDDLFQPKPVETPESNEKAVQDELPF